MKKINCWYNDLQRFLNNVNWKIFDEGDILYFTSNSQYAEYDFKVMKIDHNSHLVELKVIMNV